MHGGPAAGGGGCRLRQDAGAHAPDRASDRPGAGLAHRGARDHLHQPRRDRDEGARAAAGGRPHRRPHVGDDVPLRLRPHAAPRRRADRVPVELHDLRPGRSGAAGQELHRGPGQGSQAVRAASRARRNLPRQGSAADRRALPAAGGRLLRGGGRLGLRPLRATAVGGQRDGLRRPDHEDRAAARAGARGAAPLAAGLPLRDGRRVPGHQPRPVQAGLDPGREAPQPGGGGRPGPVDLRLPGRRHPQHQRVRTGLPERRRDRARAELPLHPDDPGRREQRDRAQPRSQAEAAVVGTGRRRRGAGGRGRGRARRGPVRGRPHPVGARRRRQSQSRSRSSTA